MKFNIEKWNNQTKEIDRIKRINKIHKKVRKW